MNGEVGNERQSDEIDSENVAAVEEIKNKKILLASGCPHAPTYALDGQVRGPPSPRHDEVGQGRYV